MTWIGTMSRVLPNGDDEYGSPVVDPGCTSAMKNKPIFHTADYQPTSQIYLRQMAIKQ